MALSTYKAANNAVGLKGTIEITGKSGWTDEKWREHSISIARYRAKQQFDNYIKSLQYEGKVWKECRAKGQCVINGNATYYTITATFE